MILFFGFEFWRERTLVCLVQHDHTVRPELGVYQALAQQHAVCHEFDHSLKEMSKQQLAPDTEPKPNTRKPKTQNPTTQKPKSQTQNPKPKTQNPNPKP